MKVISKNLYTYVGNIIYFACVITNTSGENESGSEVCYQSIPFLSGGF